MNGDYLVMGCDCLWALNPSRILILINVYYKAGDKQNATMGYFVEKARKHVMDNIIVKVSNHIFCPRIY